MSKRVLAAFRKHSLHILLYVVLFLFFCYIFNWFNLKYFLISTGIDPNFIIGFLTVMALISSLIQSSYDKKFSYNMILIESIENKGISVISKILTIKHNGELFLKTLIDHKNAISNGNIYKDANNTLSRDGIEEGMEIVSAHVQMYFPEEAENWNEILDDLNSIATLSVNITQNYIENIELIKNGINFSNIFLDNIDSYIIEAEVLNKKIDDKALGMYNRIVSKINESKGKVKSSF
jgi:hypothetical protein